MDVTEDMLKEVLLNLVMDPSRALGAGSSGGAKEGDKALNMPAPATPEEVAAVAKYVIHRFGVKPKPEDEAGPGVGEEEDEEDEEEEQQVRAPCTQR
jgi:hypothetical protein